MKKIIIGTALSMFIATPAMAQVFAVAPTTELEVVLNGEVAEFCGLTGTSGSDIVDFGELAVTPTSTNVNGSSPFGVVCNSANGVTLNVTTLNGAMLRDGTETGAGNEIAYTVNLGTGSNDIPGGPGTPPFGASTATSGRDYSYTGSAALRNGLNLNIGFQTQGVQGAGFQGAPTTTVFAGDYSDTVTVTLAAQ